MPTRGKGVSSPKGLSAWKGGHKIRCYTQEGSAMCAMCMRGGEGGRKIIIGSFTRGGVTIGGHRYFKALKR